MVRWVVAILLDGTALAVLDGCAAAKDEAFAVPGGCAAAKDGAFAVPGGCAAAEKVLT